MNVRVALRELTRDNWEECVRLRLSEDQERFVESNLYSIAESKFWPAYVPLAIYHDGTMVGFVMYGRESDGSYWISRLMIDREHQRKGDGRAAMREVIERLKQELDCEEIVLGYAPDNVAARKLYESLGFEETGLDEEGDMIARLRVAPGLSSGGSSSRA